MPNGFKARTLAPHAASTGGDLAVAPAISAALAQSFTGTTGNDDFTGGADSDDADLSQGGNDIFRGIGGDDYVYAGGAFDARDRIVGGAGEDSIDLDGDYSAGLTLRAGTINSVEDIYLYGGNSYTLTLNDGNVAALGSLAIVSAGLGASDSMIVDGSAETNGDLIIYGGAGNDVLSGGAGNDLFRTGGGTDVIDGGAGLDRVSFIAATAGVTINLNRVGVAQDTGIGLLTLSGVENISGSKFADVLTGDAKDNQFFADGGNDRINGAGGDDWLVVGPDADGVSPTGAFLNGGAGRDILDFFDNGFSTGAVTFTLASRAAQDSGQGVFSASGMEDLVGTRFDDDLTGNGVANTLYGNSGSDRLAGGSGDDVLLGDTFLGTDRPSLTNSPPVAFEGSAPGDDTLIGGGGADILTGGLGNDSFVFERLSDSTNAAPDRITDFAIGDVLDVSRIDADATRAGNQAFHLGETPGHTGDVVVSYDSGTNETTLAFHVDANDSVDMTIVLDRNHTNLSAADFNF